MASAMEILAGVFAAVILIKVLVNLISPKLSRKRAEKIMKNEALVIGLYVVLVLITGYIVVSALGIVAAFAAVTFGASLVGLSLIVYPKQVLKLTRAIMKDKKRMIFPLIVWAVLTIWTLYALFA